ncbi:MAG: YidC/Oxa1 family membrane protein insertase [Oscillospiraceae bacterium]|nr:YidC/Oxa1 family membrane protein insertase [Oscillospiraceae bacterium]
MNFIPSFITAPFAFLLRHLAELLNDYGWALIVFALIITIIRVPFDIKGKRGTMGTSLLQPKIKAIQEKYAGNQQKIMLEQRKLYQQEGVKPTAGCIWMVFPMLIILILFQIIRQPLTYLMGLSPEQIELLRDVLIKLDAPVREGALYQVGLAGDIQQYFQQLSLVVPELFATSDIFPINMNFLGLNIGEQPNWRVILGEVGPNPAQAIGLFLLPVLSTVAAFVSQRIMMATNYMQSQMQQPQMMKTMMLMMPLMSLFIGFTFPAAMSLYWTASSLLFTVASVFINRHFKKIYAAMKAEMEEKDRIKQAELDAKRKRTEELRAQGLLKENKGTSKKKKQLQEREKERQRQAANRAEDAEDDGEYNPSRIGHRKYARGRAYDPERFGDDEPIVRDLDLDEPDDVTENQIHVDDDADVYDDDDYDYDDYDDEDDDDR